VTLADSDGEGAGVGTFVEPGATVAAAPDEIGGASGRATEADASGAGGSCRPHATVAASMPATRAARGIASVSITL
jgi:hypothetical protein